MSLIPKEHNLGHEVFRVKGVTLLYINHQTRTINQTVLAPWLRIVVIDKDAQTHQGYPPAFMQVGETFTYPLIPNTSPIFKDNDNLAYLFPNVDSHDESIGLCLPKDISSNSRLEFESILQILIGIENFRNDPGPEETVQSEIRIADNSLILPPSHPNDINICSVLAIKFMGGSEKLANEIVAGAETIGELIDCSCGYIQANIPSAQEEDLLSGYPEVVRATKAINDLSEKVVEISDYLADELSEKTRLLGKYILPYLRQSSEVIYSQVMSAETEDSVETIDQILKMTGGAVVGIGTIYLGLSIAAKILAASLANNTVNLVEHTFGRTAGSIAEHSTNAIGNTLLTTTNIRGLIPSVMMKRVAVSTSEVVIETTSPE